MTTARGRQAQLTRSGAPVAGSKRRRRWGSLLLSFTLAVVGLPLAALPATAAPANIAGSATVTASSQNTGTGQTASKAVDGVVAGYPADYTREWATSGGRGGSWINLAWSTPVTIDRVVLYDRPNTSDRVASGQLSFSSGSPVSVGALNDNGTALEVTFPARTVTSLRFTISTVSATTANVGLAEFEVWGTAGTPANEAPIANAGADVNAFTGALVTLDGSASSDPNGDSLTHAWTAPAGVTLTGSTTAKPSFTAPTTPGQYTFTLVVNDGQAPSAPDTVVVTVSAPASVSTNVARSAAARASSENAATGQTAAKAIDGSPVGYPGDYTKEWATIGGKAGATLTLTWPAAVTIDRVVLYDRPNTSDRITGGQLTFSSGAPVTVPSLDNAGAATSVAFPGRTVTSLTFTVSAVATTTLNVGLAEIEVWSTATTPTNRPPVANAGADVTALTGALVTLDGSGSSDPDGNALTYSWTAPAGVSLANATSVKPTFTAAAKGTLTFSLVVHDGKEYSTADTVTVTVTDPLPVTSNLARSAAVTASSQNTTTGQTAAKAVDGSAVGYPGDYTREWATTGGGVGTLLTLTWPSPVTIDRVVVYDRPNLDDQVTAARLVPSHGAPVAVTALNNDGTATTITLPAPTVATSLVFEITGVSATTGNVGLAEIEVFGTVGGKLPNRLPVADAGAPLNAVTGRAVTLDGTDSTDPDGDPLTYAWTASGGTLTAAASATPTFKADAAGVYTLTLVVGDGSGFSAPDTVLVTVAANKAPTADAGTDQTVAPGSTVTLSGVGSDPENQSLTYSWAAPAGVTLTGPTSQKPTFTAGTTPGTVYSFTLTVSDGELTGTDTVVVTVAPLGVLTVVNNTNGSATWTANFEPSFSGKAVRFQKQTIATTMGTDMVDYVASATWVQLGQANANADGDATFTVANPLEVSHTYRAVVDQGAATERFTNEVAYEAPRTTRNTGLATVYIDTNESQAITSKDLYWEGKFTMTAPNGSRCTSVAPATMKVSGRGNSTWEMPKKPYKFAFDKAVNLCGMGQFKKWNLIANYEDDTLMRNSLTMKLGSLMTGLEWTPKSTPVDVYVNGAFQGSYTIMDRVTVDTKGRVNIPELKKNNTGLNDVAPNVTGGYLLEWDNRRTSDHNVFVGSSAVSGYVGSEQTGAYNGRGWVGIKEPEDEADGTGITAAQISYIDAYLETADAEIAKGNWEPYVDANSAADYIIAMELTKNYGANMRSSVFMYKKRDADLVTPGDQGKLYFGPLWDFDTSFGNADYAGPQELTTDGWWVSEPNSTITAVQGTPTWFHDMMDDPAFRQIVADRFNALKASGFKTQADAFITSEKSFIAQSAAADAALWGSNDFDGAVSTLQTWFNQRWTWLDTQW